MKQISKSVLFKYILWFSIFCCWELIVILEIVPRYLLPSPTDIIRALNENYDYFIDGFIQTIKNSSIGLLLSVLIGITIGSFLSISPFLNRLFFPIAHFFQTLPIIAIAPLLVIYLGFGDATVRVSALIVSLFPIIANTVVGLNSVPLEYLELYRYAQANSFTVLTQLRIGFGLPVIFSGLKISSGLAVIGAIAGEFVAGGGLGQIIDVARTQQRVDQVYLAIFLLSLIGILYLTFIQLAEYLLKKWRPYFPNQD